ncbi:hypothetical protein AMATHDRAFT_65747 [Amanita thiersii Skay4041]|uniref:Uncharacterized protein n=1 Tax=Amanita thiersii Skay4041 TaxID=703135 RepID=A0A2A9NKQ8_9AGAR|nr:hypothetical protein AMATHDRAFT_65747 [Amanita thiersii Skay4041]
MISPLSSAGVPMTPRSRIASPTLSSTTGGVIPGSEYSSSAAGFRRSASVSDFQIERSRRRRSGSHERGGVYAEEEAVYRESVARLLLARERPFSISGKIPVEVNELVLFFRSKSGITHALDFPVDLEYGAPPALDVLVAACRSHQTNDANDYTDRESLFYPPNLPLTASLDIASHPILDAVRGGLFQDLEPEKYLVAVRDKLEVVVSGSRMGVQPRMLRSDGRVATVVVTLPVRFRGGALVVHSEDGRMEKYHGRGGKPGDIEWVGFLNECDYEVETVTKGCRMIISYGLHIRTYASASIMEPSDNFLDLISPILNLSRGRKIGFYLTHNYGINPSEVVADSLVPKLRGGDALLYHSLKLYKLSPELQYTAGGYIWPVDRMVELYGDDIQSKPAFPGSMPFSVAHRPHNQPPMRGAFSVYGDADDEEVANLRARVEESGAIPLSEAEVSVLGETAGRERVYFVSQGELEKLVVHVLLIVYVP